MHQWFLESQLSILYSSDWAACQTPWYWQHLAKFYLNTSVNKTNYSAVTAE